MQQTNMRLHLPELRTMNQGLLISLLFGDQCHCWKMGCQKFGKNGVAIQHVANGVKGAR